MLEEPATNGISQHRRIGLILQVLRFDWGRAGIDARDGGEAVPRFDAIREMRVAHACSIFKQPTTMLASPLPLWERSDRIDGCDPGEGVTDYR